MVLARMTRVRGFNQATRVSPIPNEGRMSIHAAVLPPALRHHINTTYITCDSPKGRPAQDYKEKTRSLNRNNDRKCLHHRACKNVYRVDNNLRVSPSPCTPLSHIGYKSVKFSYQLKKNKKTKTSIRLSMLHLSTSFLALMSLMICSITTVYSTPLRHRRALVRRESEADCAVRIQTRERECINLCEKYPSPALTVDACQANCNKYYTADYDGCQSGSFGELGSCFHLAANRFDYCLGGECNDFWDNGRHGCQNRCTFMYEFDLSQCQTLS